MRLCTLAIFLYVFYSFCSVFLVKRRVGFISSCQIIHAVAAARLCAKMSSKKGKYRKDEEMNPVWKLHDTCWISSDNGRNLSFDISSLALGHDDL